VHLKSKKLPLSLVKDTFTKSLSDGERLLQVQGFEQTYGPKAQRKRPTIKYGDTPIEALQEDGDLANFVANANQAQDNYKPLADKDFKIEDKHNVRDMVRDPIFNKGLSKRIWEELYKVIDSSDVVIYVLDARDPNGTRTKSLEEHLKKNCPQKHLVFVMNKCDLVPTNVTQKWVRYLSQFAPTLAF